MSNLPLFAGLDCHQNHVQVCVIDQKENVPVNRKVSSDVAQVAQLLNRLGNVQAVAIRMQVGGVAA